MSHDKEPLEAWVITDLVQRYEIEGDTQFIRVSAFNAALDELKAEVERFAERYKNIELANKEWSRNDAVTFGQLITKNQELTAALRDMVGALERLTKVGPPSVPTTGADWAAQCLKDNCEIAMASLAKHADLIARLK